MRYALCAWVAILLFALVFAYCRKVIIIISNIRQYANGKNKEENIIVKIFVNFNPPTPDIFLMLPSVPNAGRLFQRHNFSSQFVKFVRVWGIAQQIIQILVIG